MASATRGASELVILAKLRGGANDGETLPLPGTDEEHAPEVIVLDEILELESSSLRFCNVYEKGESEGPDHRGYVLVDYDHARRIE